jgi:tetratricopeptide (TPR) repeat protein
MRTEQEELEVEERGSVGGAQPVWLQAAMNKWQVYAGIAVVITLAVAGVWWYSTTQQEKNEEAAAHLAKVRPVFDAGNFANALSGDSVAPAGQDKALGLAEISDQYSGTDAGRVAALMAGNSLVNLGKHAEAVAHFERASSSDALIIEVGSTKGLAICQEAAGDFAGAAVLYEQAAQRAGKTGMAEDCLLAAAFCYEKTGDKVKAGQLFTEIVKRYESSTSAPLAKSGLARLGMAID